MSSSQPSSTSKGSGGVAERDKRPAGSMLSFTMLCCDATTSADRLPDDDDDVDAVDDDDADEDVEDDVDDEVPDDDVDDDLDEDGDDFTTASSVGIGVVSLKVTMASLSRSVLASLGETKR